MRPIIFLRTLTATEIILTIVTYLFRGVQLRQYVVAHHSEASGCGRDGRRGRDRDQVPVVNKLTVNGHYKFYLLLLFIFIICGYQW